MLGLLEKASTNHDDIEHFPSEISKHGSVNSFALAESKTVLTDKETSQRS